MQEKDKVNDWIGGKDTQEKSILPNSNEVHPLGLSPSDSFSPELVTTAVIQIAPLFDEAVAKLSAETQRLAGYARQLDVSSPEGVKHATEDLSLMANIKKALEDKRKEYVGPLNDYTKAINNAFKTISEPLTEADGIVRGKILAYNREQERILAIAAEIERKQRELLEATGEIQDAPVVDAVKVDKVFTEVGSMGTRKVRKWEIEDFALLSDEYKMADANKIGKVVRAGLNTIPGVRIWEEDTLVIQARNGE